MINQWIKWVIGIVLIIFVIYLILGNMGVIPMYQCSSYMSAQEGAIKVCGWYVGGPPNY